MTTRNARIRFCANNLAAGSGATCTASSANASYPLSNVLDNRRWKTWRTNGNFTITAGTNDKIYVNDTANVTATLTAGNYSGGAALAAHIQTQLNAVSTNWTCTYSSTTYRFTIGRSSGTATLRMTVTTAAAWSTIGYSRATDLAVGTGTAAETMAVHTSESVVVDLGAGQPTEFFSIVGQLGTVFPISSGATVRLYASNVNNAVGWATPALTYTLSVDTHGIYQFLDANADTSYRYWKFEFIDKLNPNGPAFEFAYLYLGTYETVTQSNVSNGFQKRLVDTSQMLLSDNGAPFFNTGVKYFQWEQAEISNMLAADRRVLEQVFYTVGKGTPLFVSFDPTLVGSLESGEYTQWVFFTDTPTWVQLRKDVYAVSMSFREVI